MKAKFTNQEIVLRHIRDASYKPYERDLGDIDFDARVFAVPDDNPLIVFAEELNRIGGKFIYCDSQQDMALKLASLLDHHQWLNPVVQDTELKRFFKERNMVFQDGDTMPIDAKVGISYCESLIGRLGSVLVSSWSNPGRQMHAYPEIHIVIAHSSQVVMTLGEAFRKLRKKYAVDFPSELTLISGPSRTADIEKTLVMGAHGPKELFVFVVAD